MSINRVHMTTLDNGLRIVTDPLPHSKTASIEVLNPVGTAFENVQNNGAAHFAEHLLLKSNKYRTSAQVKTVIANSGGSQNAHTNHETTRYEASVLADYVYTALDATCDQVLYPLLLQKEIIPERGVILDEYSVSEDSGDVWADIIAQKTSYSGQPLGFNILGTRETIAAMSRKQLRGFWEEYYDHSGMIIVASGNIDPSKIVDQAAQKFQGKKPRTFEREQAVFNPGHCFLNKKLEQVSLQMNFEGFRANHDDEAAIEILADIVGGYGLTSRLFQEVREKRGYAYGVSMGYVSYKDTGLLFLQCGTSEKNSKDCTSVICDVLAKAGDQEAFTPEEIERSKKQLIAAKMFNMERTADRASKWSDDIAYSGRPVTDEEAIGAIEKVDAARLNALAREIFSKKPVVTAVGPVKKMESYDKICGRLNLA